MGDGESVDFVPVTDAGCFEDDGGYGGGWEGCWVVVGEDLVVGLGWSGGCVLVGLRRWVMVVVWEEVVDGGAVMGRSEVGKGLVDETPRSGDDVVDVTFAVADDA